MDGDVGLSSGCSQKENKRYFVLDVEEMEDSVQDAEEHCTNRHNKEPKHSLSQMRQLSDNSGTKCVESSSFMPVYPVNVPCDRWREKEEEAHPSSMLDCSVYLDDQHNVADCTSPAIIAPVTNVTLRPCPFIPVPTLTTHASPDNLVHSTTDTCSPFSSKCSTTCSPWDMFRSTSRRPGCSDMYPVSAAAHLHLLGESLSLIGLHLQETDKKVCVSIGLSLLLDSLLCALAPLICITTQIPELRSCTQHTLVSTLENIAYVMPGL